MTSVEEIGRDMGRELAIRADERRRIGKAIRMAAGAALERTPGDPSSLKLHRFAEQIADMLEGVSDGAS